MNPATNVAVYPIVTVVTWVASQKFVSSTACIISRVSPPVARLCERMVVISPSTDATRLPSPIGHRGEVVLAVLADEPVELVGLAGPVGGEHPLPVGRRRVGRHPGPVVGLVAVEEGLTLGVAPDQGGERAEPVADFVLRHHRG